MAISPSRSPVGSVVPSDDERVDAVSSYVKWGSATATGATVTYSFADYGSTWVAGYPEPANGFQPLSEGQRAAVRAALALWEKVGNIDFVEVEETASVDGDIRFGISGLPRTAESRLPGRAPEAGDVWLGLSDHAPNDDKAAEHAKYAPGTYHFAVVVHEIGHAIGAKHLHEAIGGNAVLPASEDWLGASVMSYRDAPSDPVSTGTSASIYPSGPMELDVAWIRSVYGSSAKSNLGNTTYRWTRDQAVFETIVDDGGNDTLDWSNQSSAARLDLAGGWQEVGPSYRWDKGSLAATLFLYGAGTIENARGGSGNDRILGSDRSNLLVGNGGDDRLVGSGGSDRLEGGAGSDTYVVDPGSGVDLIIESAGTDQIEFGSRMSFTDLQFTAGGTDLQVTLKTSSSFGLVLTDQLGGQGVEQLLFEGDQSLFTWNGTAFASTPVAASSPTEGSDLLILTDGPDTVYALGGDDVVFGKGGNDLIDGGNGQDWLVGGAGNDQLVGGNREDKLDGGDGADKIFGGAAADILRGGQGDDVIQAGDAADIAFGAPGNDTLYGGDGDDLNLVGGLGNDTIYAGAGADSVDGAAGRDILDGGEDNDLVVGGTGDDDLGGASGNDTLRGGFGNDQLDGGDGDDILSGGFGNDLLLGDDGRDLALYNGTAAQYQIRKLANGDVEVRHLPAAGIWYGVDQLSHVELIKFGNAAPITLG